MHYTALIHTKIKLQIIQMKIICKIKFLYKNKSLINVSVHPKKKVFVVMVFDYLGRFTAV